MTDEQPIDPGSPPADADSQPSAGAADAAPDVKADLGVLFVHGIGQQRRGDTLLAAGEALHEWLARWFTEGKVARGTSRGLLADDEVDVGAPAHVYTEMTQDDTTSGWWLAESWWAESFPPPGFADLAVWGFQVMPWTLASHFGARARRAKSRIGWPGGWRTKVWSSVRFAVDLLLLLFSFALLVPLVVVFGLLAVVGAVPIRGLRSFVGRVQRVLSSSLGDSYVLLTSPIQAAAIEETVRRDLAWVAGRSKQVAVVAHSQGAAISHAVLRGDIPDNVALFVSVGSGLNKLKELQRAKEAEQPNQVTPREGSALPYLGSVGIGLMGYALYRALSGGETDGIVLWMIAAAGAMSLLAAAVKAWRGYPPKDVEELVLPKSIKWIDLYASADPVPNGPLFDPDEAPRVAGPRNSLDPTMGFDQLSDPTPTRADKPAPSDGGTLPESAVVHNRGSMVKDHNDYWRNRDGFMGAVAQQLGMLCEGVDFSTITRGDVARLGVAPRRRRLRVWWLGAARAVIMVIAASVPLILLWRNELQEVGLPVTGAVEWLLDIVPGYTSPELSGLTTDLAAVTSILVAAFIAFVIIQWLWRWWGYVETHRLYRRLHYEGLPLQALLASATLIMAIEVGVLTALGHSSGLGAAYRESAVSSVAIVILGVFLLVFVDRGLDFLWRKLPGGRSLIGAPGILTSTRLMMPAVVIALVMFTAYGRQAALGLDLAHVNWLFYVSVVVVAAFPLVWSTAPIYERRRSVARRSYAGNMNLAQLRHAASPADRVALLEDATQDIAEMLVSAGSVIAAQQAEDPDAGEAGPWRYAERAAHEAARDAVDIHRELEDLPQSAAAREILEKGSTYCAKAALVHIDVAGLDDGAAHAILEPLTNRGPRRDRRIARRALRGLQKPVDTPTPTDEAPVRDGGVAAKG